MSVDARRVEAAAKVVRVLLLDGTLSAAQLRELLARSDEVVGGVVPREALLSDAATETAADHLSRAEGRNVPWAEVAGHDVWRRMARAAIEAAVSEAQRAMREDG